MTSVTPTLRWRGIVVVALAAAAVGVLAARPSVVLLSVVGIAFVAYPKLTTPMAGDSASNLPSMACRCWKDFVPLFDWWDCQRSLDSPERPITPVRA